MSGTSSDNEYTTSDNESYKEWQPERTSDNEWQRMTTGCYFG